MNDEDPLPETLDVVVLQQRGDKVVPVAGTTPVSLDRDAEPFGDILDALLDSTVQLAAEDGVPEQVREVIRNAPVPPAFRHSPWLARHRALVMHDGELHIDTLTLHYTDRDGLTYTYPESEETKD